jgi:hypothetical protein
MVALKNNCRPLGIEEIEREFGLTLPAIFQEVVRDFAITELSSGVAPERIATGILEIQSRLTPNDQRDILTLVVAQVFTLEQREQPGWSSDTEGLTRLASWFRDFFHGFLKARFLLRARMN